jgi:glycosyltransferase involved in cell wall biosynthesis
MKNQNPLVSILLPVHNNERHLRECLESLLSQSYKNLEIIAIDDNSRDKSYKLLKEAKKKDKRVRIYKNVKRYGLCLTLNRALRRSKGQFIAVMEATDRLVSTKIRKQVKFLLANQDISAVGTQCLFINEINRKIGKSEFPEENHTIYSSPLHGISVQFETLLINKFTLPKDLLKFKSNSHPFIYNDLLLKILPYGKIANLNEHLHLHRKHPEEYFNDLKKNFKSFIKLGLKSIILYNYKPQFKSLTPIKYILPNA